jgi:PAS domain S-box-containing protein
MNDTHSNPIQSFKDLCDRLPDGILVQCEGKIVFANSSLAALLGYAQASELLGREALSLIHQDDREGAVDRILSLGRHKEVSPAWECRLLGREGTLVDAESTDSAILFEGRLATISALRDIRLRKVALEEQRRQNLLLQAIYQGAGIGILLTDDSANILEMNPEASRMLGLVEGDLAKGNLNPYLGHPNGFNTLWSTLLKEGSLRSSAMLRNLQGPDRDIVVMGQVQIVPGKNLILMADPEGLRAEPPGRPSAAGAGLPAVVHDINNILMVIQMNCDLMLEELGTDQGLGLRVTAIRDSSGQASSLIRSLGPRRSPPPQVQASEQAGMGSPSASVRQSGQA